MRNSFGGQTVRTLAALRRLCGKSPRQIAQKYDLTLILNFDLARTASEDLRYFATLDSKTRK
jgi:hypothetical protein